MLFKCCNKYVRKFGKLSSDHRVQKGQFSFQFQKRAGLKNVQTTRQLHSLPMVRLCSKSFKLGFSSTWIKNVQVYKLGLEKGRGARGKFSTFAGSQRKQGFQKNICFIVYMKAFVCVDHNKLCKILKEMGIPDHLTCLQRNLYAGQVEKWEPYMQQLTGSKLGEEYEKAVYCHLFCLTYMQSTSREMLGWMSYKLESRLPGEISITSDMQTIPL